MKDLQEIRSSISSKIVDLGVEKKRLEALKKKLKEVYNIDVDDIKREVKNNTRTITKLEKIFLRKKKELSTKLEKWAGKN